MKKGHLFGEKLKQDLKKEKISMSEAKGVRTGKSSTGWARGNGH